MSSVSCPSCGSSLAQQMRFCPDCGAAIRSDAGGLATATSPPPEGLRAATPGGIARGSRPALTPSGAFDHGRFSPGTLLGDRYRIVGLLGRGGMGEVYRADDLQLGQPVALKFLPGDVERDPVRLERFVAEVRTARQISHPNVCRVYDIGEVEGRRFLSMEYIDGEDLRSLLRRIGRLPKDKGLQIARQVCAGLAAMHDRRVLHRDLKPANVMLDGDGRARLTDFGLATAVTGLASDEIAGTPAYMAPEQLAGEPLSAQTDLYALGLLLYELFTGERVHKTDRPDELRELHRAGRTAPLSKSSSAPLDPAIARVIERCLERDPKKRPAGAIAVAAALPGGDPLAAALAAGETPSPQMVAASGEEGALSPKVGVPLLAALLILTGVVVWLNGRQQYTAIVPFRHSPEVLATKAADMLERLGYQDPPADSGFGFGYGTGDYTTWVAQRDTSRNRWQHLGSVRPPILQFWYRTSPEGLVPTAFWNNTAGVVLTPTDPPLTTPGMAYIELDLTGRLVGLRTVLPEKEVAAAPAPSPDWPRLFTEAGLDVGLFRPVTPEWTAPAGADARAAWLGPGADATGAELRVEAASHRGRPVFFKFVAPWTELPGDTTTPGEPWGAAILLGGIAGLTIFLAIRNTRHGRADQRSATRLAVTMGLIILTAGIIQFRPAASFDPTFTTFVIITSWAAFVGLMMWIFYTALEPYARRRWPQMLISWSRLLEGRWRDPLIGRDLLIGSVLGMTMTVLAMGSTWLKASPPPPTTNEIAMMGLTRFFVALLSHVPIGVWAAFGWIMLLTGLRIILRSERLAIIGFVVVFLAPRIVNVSGETAVVLSLQALTGVANLLVATRFGLMAFLAMSYIRFFQSAASLTPPPPLVGPAVLAVIAMLAPGVFGFYTSRARRSSATATWLDE